ncbi:MAG: fibronectin type III domain-containing protein [Actinomycetota bacterium]
MSGRPSSIRCKIATAFVLVASLTAVPSVSQADPIDDVQNLLVSVSNFVASGVSEEMVIVSWQRESLLAGSFRIEKATDEAGPYTKVVVVGSSICGPNGNCVTQVKFGPPASPTPFFLRVVPLLSVGVPDIKAGGLDIRGTDPESRPVLLEGKPSEPDPVMLGPRKPTDVKCNGGGALSCVNVNSVTITWTDNSDEDVFWIMRGRGATNVDFGSKERAVIPANQTSFSEFIDEYGVFYSYRVVAVRERAIPRLSGAIDTERSFSNGAPEVTVETAPVAPPSDPSGLTATFTPPSTVELSWIDGVAPGFNYIDEDGWFIEQTIGNADYTSPLASQHTRAPLIGQGSVSFTTSVPPNTLRCYRVRGYRATTTFTAPAYSGYTNTVCMGAPPSSPIGLRATALRNDLVRLDWNDTSNAETNFVVQRCNGVCTSSSAWVDLDTGVPADTVTYDDTTTVGLTTYSYRVFAENPSGRSAPSNIRTVTTPAAPIAAPTSLLATATGSREITLTWNDPITGESGFRIEFKDFDGLFKPLNSVGANVTLYVDTESLSANQTRCYRVRTIMAQQVSDPSNVSCATTLPPAAANGAPTNLTATVVSNTEIQLDWNDTATNESRFEVEAIEWTHLACPQNGTGIPFTKKVDVNKFSGTGSVSYRVSGLVPHTAYIFRVRAANFDGPSAYSNDTGCAQTFGPIRPTFLDPEENADTEAMRCDFTVKEPVVGPDGAGGLRVYVNAYVPATNVAHTDTLWAINAGGTVPGSQHAPDRNHYIKQPGNGLTVNAADQSWTISYQFRRGIRYRLIVTAYGLNAPYYASASNEVRDVTVLADCPTSGI